MRSRGILIKIILVFLPIYFVFVKRIVYVGIFPSHTVIVFHFMCLHNMSQLFCLFNLFIPLQSGRVGVQNSHINCQNYDKGQYPKEISGHKLLFKFLNQQGKFMILHNHSLFFHRSFLNRSSESAPEFGVRTAPVQRG